ncbi:hypothetical protein [Pseudalkalibacillus caeni]|uniref:hypothetical protein n=1 Tax=Exobacillus caeni TaxID=2574798 RepID=UPI0014852BF4|nr:hypothetical protein [Pseudalkalibacillus caeni]
MESKEKVIEEYSRLIKWLEEAQTETEKLWHLPVSEGKWSPAAIVSHFYVLG